MLDATNSFLGETGIELDAYGNAGTDNLDDYSAHP